MKRLISVVLLLLLVPSLISCSNNIKNTTQPTVSFYYCNDIIDYNSETAVIAPEFRDVSMYTKDCKSIIDVYLMGPLSDEYRSPFPANSVVTYWEQKETLVKIELSDNFSTLKGHNLTIACACLAKTIIQLTACTSVEITAKDSSLDGNISIIMSNEDLLFLDKSI